MEQIWIHIITNELNTTAEEHPLLISDVPLSSKQQREKLTQVVFESFNAPCFYLSVKSVLSLYSSGRTSGLVLDSGD